ncbi:MAG: hypothetical protein ACYTE3_09215, partial [Planctomycetota bacterium]
MRASVRSALSCLVVLCACWPVSAQSPAGEVETLRQEAAASRTKTEADQKLDQAEALLAKSRKSMDSLDYTFLQNEITQA